MYWVIQNNLYSEEGFNALLRALEVMGLPHSVHKIVPFVHTLDPEPVIPAGMKVIALGAYTMLSIAKARGWRPGAYELDYQAELPEQLRYWHGRLLNADAWVGRLGDVEPFRKPSFIRPIRDTKAFSGKVMDWTDFTEWRDNLPNVAGERLGPDTIVLVAPKKTIYAEYRTWIVGRKVVSASQYKQGTRVVYNSDVPEGILAFAQECADLGPEIPAYVLDVAVVHDDLLEQYNQDPIVLRIVETNTINAAGWYKGNVGKIVAALEELESS